ncbi:MAG: hypothetical protein HKN44_12460 [Ilumatobacter sp.]|nr:hypothetical protein [Ilumatobacter sp.]
MDRAPIPPHERPWRHPSELGPTGVEPGGSGRHRAVLFAGGTLAVVMVAALVVAMTPQRSGSPLAVSATTGPAVSADGRGDAPDDADRAARIASVKAIPNAIVDVPGTHGRPRPSTGVDQDATAVLPDLDDEVLVLTENVAYALPWSEVAWLEIDDAVVVNSDGAIVARFEAGRLIVAADAVVGAALTVTDD